MKIHSKQYSRLTCKGISACRAPNSHEPINCCTYNCSPSNKCLITMTEPKYSAELIYDCNISPQLHVAELFIF